MVQIEDGKFDLKINSFFFKDLIEAEEQGVLNHKEKGYDYNKEEVVVDNDDENKNIIHNNYIKHDSVNQKYDYNNEEENDYKKGDGLID